MQLAYQIFSSPLGEILVAGTPFAVTHIVRGDNKTLLASEFLLHHGNRDAAGDVSYIREICGAILDYMHGRGTLSGISIAPEGTQFQREVWQALCRIPYGHTASYSEIASSIGAPDAFRAVAHACAENPIPLIIPCHRVIHKNGDISGFAWGEDAKRFLLEMEKEHMPAAMPAVSSVTEQFV